VSEDLSTALADAFATVTADPDGDHSPWTTLAPVYEATTRTADDHWTERVRLVDAHLPVGAGETTSEVAPLLDVSCGTGGLLSRLERPAVGLDDRPSLLPYARRRVGGPVVAGDPTGPPVPSDAAIAGVALGYATARHPATEVLAALADAVTPDGGVVVDAATEPRAVLDDDHEGAAGGYRFRRSVVAGRVRDDRAEMGVEYTLTAPDGRETETTRHRSVRLYDRGSLRRGAEAAGLEAVTVEPGSDGGSLVVEGRAP